MEEWWRVVLVPWVRRSVMFWRAQSLGEQWGDRVTRAAARPGRAHRLTCPSCGVRALVLRYRPFEGGSTDDEDALLLLWCSSCLTGYVNKAPVPRGATWVEGRDPVPNFTLAPRD